MTLEFGMVIFGLRCARTMCCTARPHWLTGNKGALGMPTNYGSAAERLHCWLCSGEDSC